VIVLPKPKVVMTRKILEPGISIIKEDCDLVLRDKVEPPTRRELLDLVRDADGLLCLLTEKIDKEVYDAGRKLRVVSTMSVGYDHVDVPEATKRGIYVCYTPGVLTNATADFAWTLIMATSRRLVEGDKYVREGKWVIPWAPDMLLGYEVYGATLGVVGIGRIGQAVIERSRGFKMKVLYYDVIRRTDLEKELGIEYCEIDDLLKRSDIVTIHVPRSKETIGLINENNLKLMKPSAVVVNTSRGGIIDERGLYKALSNGWIFAAGLDVHEKEPTPMEDPLLKLPNIIVAPHIASATHQSRSKMSEFAALNLVKVLKGEEPPALVNQEVKNIRPLDKVKMI
jgi:glyoxylate reductase